MMIFKQTMAVAVLATQLSAPAQAQNNDAGRDVGETIFTSMTGADRDTIHMGDIETFRASVFAGMDYDSNDTVTYDEFTSWDPGFATIAADAGRSDAYATASKIVFAFWDRDGNGAMTAAEMRFAMSADFRRADINDDGMLTRNEFIDGFVIMVAMRAAIRPDL